jgi:hypothetical protein
MNRVLRHVTFIVTIAACVWLSGLGWYLTFTPGQSPWFFLAGGLVFGLAAVVLTFLWRLGSMLD